jgi:hypothetical protein
MNLKDFHDEMVKVSDYKTWPVRSNSFHGQELLRKMENGAIKFNDTGINRGILSMLLFGVDLPKCYFTEDMNGKRTCIYGHSILSTIKAILSDKEREEKEFFYYNKVNDAVVPVITFESKVPQAQIDSFLFHLKEIY